MRSTLVTRYTGTQPSAQSRYAGLASITLLGIALMTAPARGGGKSTPYNLINAAAGSCLPPLSIVVNESNFWVLRGVHGLRRGQIEYCHCSRRVDA